MQILTKHTITSKFSLNDVCTGCYVVVYVIKYCSIENQRIAARDKLFKLFKSAKTKPSNLNPEGHMAITNIQQPYLNLSEFEYEKI